MRHHTLIAATALIASFALGCGSFDLLDPNNPSEDDLLNNPTPSKISVAGTGLFVNARAGITGEIWVLGSYGREGVRLLGNNQPDYQEPFFGPIQQQKNVAWGSEYILIRGANTFLSAIVKTAQLSDAQKAAGIGLAQTLKGLAILRVIATRGKLGAPVDVGRSLSEDPAPFVSEDGVYNYVRALLDSAEVSLQAGASADFPVSIPDGFADFGTPDEFIKFTRALSAKAEVFHGSVGCGTACFQRALTKLGQTYLTLDPDALSVGPAYDFSSRAGDAVNNLSDPLNGADFFALRGNLTEAQLQPSGALDRRVLDKVTDATRDPPQTVGGFPITGELKFTNYLAGGRANTAAPIPILKNEELILLRAEANIGLGNKAAAIADLDFVRSASGGLAPSGLTGASSNTVLIDELLYNRRFSLLWEQGARWIDAKRYNRLDAIPVAVPGGSVPTEIPIPDVECQARNLSGNCRPLGG